VAKIAPSLADNPNSKPLFAPVGVSNPSAIIIVFLSLSLALSGAHTALHFPLSLAQSSAKAQALLLLRLCAEFL
jgi:hypothetical protein